MKNVLAIAILVALLGGAAFWFMPRAKGGASQPKDPEPFAKEFKLDAQSAKFLLEGDTANTLAASGRFYWPSDPLPGNMALEYDEARAAKVKEILAQAAGLVKAVRASSKTLSEFRTAYFAFLDQLGKKVPKTSDFVNASVAGIGRAATMRGTALSAYGGLAVTSSTNPYTSALLTESAVYQACNAGLGALMETEQLAAYAAMGVLATESHADPGVKSASAALNQQFEGVGKLVDEMKPIAEHISKIRDGVRQLEAADADYARAALAHVRKGLPGLRDAVKIMKPSEEVPEGDLAFINAYLDLLDIWSAEVNTKVGSAKAIAQLNDTYQYAWEASADDDAGSYSSGYSNLKKSLTDYGSAVGSVAGAMWETAKAGAKKLQRGAQLTTDHLGTGVKMWSQIGWGVYNGNSWKDIRKDLNEYGKDLRDNYNGKLPQKTTLRTAKEMLDEVERVAEETTAHASEKVMSKGWGSWLAGKASKMVVGAFSGLAKGIYLVADPSSSKSDLVEGTLEIGFATLGGTKSLAKASEVPGAANELLKVAKEGASYFTRKRLAAQIEKLKQLMGPGAGDDFAKYLSNLRELSAARTSLEALEAARTEMLKRLGSMSGEVLERIGDATAGSIDDVFRTRFAATTERLGALIKGTFGKNAGEVADSLTASIFDDVVKDAFAGILVTRLSREQIAGSYSATMTITKLDVNEEEVASSSGDSDGCVPSGVTAEALKKAIEQAMKEMIDKPMPGTMSIVPKSDNEGTMFFVTKSSPTRKPMRYTYDADGGFLCTAREKGATIRITGSFKEEGGRVRFDGALSAESKGGSMAGTLTASK